MMMDVTLDKSQMFDEIVRERRSVRIYEQDVEVDPAAMQRKLNMASAGNRGVLPTSSLRPATQPGFRPSYPTAPGGQAQADEQKAWFEANAIPAFLRPKA